MSIKAEFTKRIGAFSLEISFSCGDEILALIGGSGCGKSMTLKCIAGIEKPDEGYIVVDDRVFFDSAAHINIKPQLRNTGFMFQNYALFPNMTVRENIMAVLSHGAYRGKRGHTIYTELIKKFYLNGLEEHYPSQLSGGQQQRAALARIMASQPVIIMLDEPLSALDTFLRRKLESELAQTLSEFRGTSLYVSHDRDEVFRVCDKVCVINGGKSESIKCVKDFFNSPETLSAAILAGYKNISAACADKDRVFAKNWNIMLECNNIPTCSAQKESSRLTRFAKTGKSVRWPQFVAINAHKIILTDKLREGGNGIAAKILSIQEELFETAINIIPLAASENSEHSIIQTVCAKEYAKQFKAGETVFAEIKKDDVIILSE